MFFQMIFAIIIFYIFVKYLLSSPEPKRLFKFNKERIHEIIKDVLSKYEAENPEEKLGYAAESSASSAVSPAAPNGKTKQTMEQIFAHVAHALQKEYGKELIQFDDDPKKQESVPSLQ